MQNLRLIVWDGKRSSRAVIGEGGARSSAPLCVLMSLKKDVCPRENGRVARPKPTSSEEMANPYFVGIRQIRIGICAKTKWNITSGG